MTWRKILLQSTPALPLQSKGNLNQRFGGKTIIAVILSILVIILIGIATTFSWWSISSDGTSLGLYLNNACSGSSCQSYQGNPTVNDVFRLTNTLVLASLSLSVVTLIFFVLSILLPVFRRASLITGVTGSALLLAAPIYLYFALPGALSSSGVNSFFGSTTQNTFIGTITATWGGGTGWFMAIAVAGFFSISTVVEFFTARRVAQLGNFPFSQHPPTTMPNSKMMFCPACGSQYPKGTQYCSRDATALKEMKQ